MALVQRFHSYSDFPEICWNVVETPHRDELIPDDVYSTYEKALKEYCENTIEENSWTISFTDGIHRITISFDSLDVSGAELRLVKAYIVDTLSHYSSPSTCASKIKSLSFLFRFLHENGYRATMISTALINLFRLWLDEIDTLNAEKKNSIESDLAGFIDFLREHELVRPGVIAIPLSRPTTAHEPKRAPDKMALSQLDAYFLDFTIDIPCTYRCLYILLRLIPARNLEVLSMTVDDFVVNDGLLEVRIPTYKETANHRPVYQSHYRFAEGYPEELLLRSLQEQREFALRCQKSIEAMEHKGRLMVSPRSPERLVSSNEFNDFLKDTCEMLNITDAHGVSTYITMYSLRHANGAAMARSTEITPQEFSRAFAHNSQYSDDSYGYASKHDEMQYTAPFTEQLHRKLLLQEPSDVAQTVTPMHLSRLQRDPTTHLIGSHSVCRENECTPQFMRCVFCGSYRPDPQFISEAERCCELLRQRIEQCRIAEDDINLKFNERQLSAYTEFVRRAKRGRG